MTVRKLAPFLIKFIISAGLLTWLFQGTDITSLLSYVNTLTIVTLVLTSVIISITAIALGYRWNIILGYMNASLPLVAAAKNVIIGFFFNQFLPSTVGGDVARIWLAKRRGLSISLAANSIVSDRIFGFVGLVLLCAIGLPFLAITISNDVMVYGEGLLILVGFGGVAGLIVLQYIPSDWKKWHVLRWAVSVSDASAGVVLKSGKGTSVLAISLVLHTVDVGLVYMMALACGIEIDLALCFMLIPSALLVSAVPISIAGWGVREGAIVFALGAAGVVPAEAITLSLFFGLAQALSGLIGGLVWVLSPNEKVDIEQAEKLLNPTTD